jgi:hypothetical protein
MSIDLNNPEFRRFWKDIYHAAIKAGDTSYTAANKADTAVLDLIRRGKQ